MKTTHKSSFFPTVLRETVIQGVKTHDANRHTLQQRASSILSASKRAIFAFHRGDPQGAENELMAARKEIAVGRNLIKQELRLAHEGTWRACLEEFCEAVLFAQYVTHGAVQAVPEIEQDPELFLGGFSDMLGELVRRAMLLATEQRDQEVERIFQDAREAIAFFLQMDLTGVLRTKTDQAKQHLRRLEEIRYEIMMKKRGR